MYLVVSGAVAGGAALVTGVLIAALMLAVIVRSWQLKLAVGEDVTVVNWRRTVHLPWSDVTRFGYDRSGLWILRSNQQKVAVAAFALGRGVPKMRLYGEAVKDQLEELRRERRKPGPGRGGRGGKKRR